MKALAILILVVAAPVVVDAYGDDEFDLEAVDIRIVPPIDDKGGR